MHYHQLVDLMQKFQLYVPRHHRLLNNRIPQ
jgi:hypothetical protein